MKYNNLKLNGSVYSKEELMLLANGMLQMKRLSEHEHVLFSFIKEWLSPGDEIKLKTSGSTGTPKTIMVRKEQMIESAKMTCKYFHLNKDSNLLLCLSADFIAGKMMVVRTFVCGGNLIVTEPNGNPLKELKRKVDFVAMVPLQVEKILSSLLTKKKFNTIDNVIIGGAALPHSLERNIAKMNNNVYATFAMTETLSHVALRKLNGKNKSDYFELLPGVEIKKDKRACMVVNAPKLNDDAIVTNDVIDILDKKHFRWLGRYDNAINSGGVKIYPEKVEEKLSEIITHNRFFITTQPDEKLGEKIALVIEGIKAKEIDAIRKKAEKILSKYEKPREYIVIQKFAETFNGKVKRRETLQLTKK